MDYISCFSGIGGLEGSASPLIACELDDSCHDILRATFSELEIHPDIETLVPPHAEVVAGGWPCQDISIAGLQAGLSGVRSKLLYELLRVAKDSKAHTLIAENVTNLLRLAGGLEFQNSLKAIHEAGFPFIGWRVLNAREFGLPQHRTRLIIIASKEMRRVASLFRDTPKLDESVVSPRKASMAAGFYWTAGTHSINYSRGYTPTVKVGSSLNIPSPPAVHYGENIRQISPSEALSLQGFNSEAFSHVSAKDVFRMAGNAVPRPIGRWVFEGIENEIHEEYSIDKYPPQLGLFSIDAGVRFHSKGVSVNGEVSEVKVPKTPNLATNLIDYLDTTSEDSLSPRAASGLLRRLERSGQTIDGDLHRALREVAEETVDG